MLFRSAKVQLNAPWAKVQLNALRAKVPLNALREKVQLNALGAKAATAGQSCQGYLEVTQLYRILLFNKAPPPPPPSKFVFFKLSHNDEF